MADAATKACGRCKTQIPAGANFCFHCGWPFGREPLAPPPVAEPQDPFADWSDATERVDLDNEQAREDIRARLAELAQEAEESGRLLPPRTRLRSRPGSTSRKVPGRGPPSRSAAARRSS